MVQRFVIQGDRGAAVDSLGTSGDTSTEEAAQDACRNFRRSRAIVLYARLILINNKIVVHKVYRCTPIELVVNAYMTQILLNFLR